MHLVAIVGAVVIPGVFKTGGSIERPHLRQPLHHAEDGIGVGAAFFGRD